MEMEFSFGQTHALIPDVPGRMPKLEAMARAMAGAPHRAAADVAYLCALYTRATEGTCRRRRLARRRAARYAASSSSSATGVVYDGGRSSADEWRTSNLPPSRETRARASYSITFPPHSSRIEFQRRPAVWTAFL